MEFRKYARSGSSLDQHFMTKSITSISSFVGEPQCNEVSERFIRTLKEPLLHVFYFQTIEDLRKALLKFKECYNAKWLV